METNMDNSRIYFALNTCNLFRNADKNRMAALIHDNFENHYGGYWKCFLNEAYDDLNKNFFYIILNVDGNNIIIQRYRGRHE